MGGKPPQIRIKKIGYIPVIKADTYEYGDCRILVSKDMGRWHLSISHPKRYPTWDEIKYARYKLIPSDITMVMILPPPDEYINLHPNCFHLWETVDRVAGEWG